MKKRNFTTGYVILLCFWSFLIGAVLVLGILLPGGNSDPHFPDFWNAVCR